MILLPALWAGARHIAISCASVLATAASEHGHGAAYHQYPYLTEGNSMIEAIDGLPGGTIGARFNGKVIADDYTDVLIPMIESALRRHDKLKVLIIFDDDFTGFGAKAVWQDSKLGIQHWRGCERIFPIRCA